MPSHLFSPLGPRASFLVSDVVPKESALTLEFCHHKLLLFYKVATATRYKFSSLYDSVGLSIFSLNFFNYSSDSFQVPILLAVFFQPHLPQVISTGYAPWWTPVFAFDALSWIAANIEATGLNQSPLRDAFIKFAQLLRLHSIHLVLWKADYRWGHNRCELLISIYFSY